MDVSTLTAYANPIVFAICLCTGYVIKNLIPTDALNRYIPLIMACEGILICMWMNMGISPEIILGGMFSGLASTGCYEAFKNLLSAKE